jgi:branched-chain amino acid transport system permease protein
MASKENLRRGPKVSRTARRAGLAVALLITLILTLAGCGPSVETDQARLCRMAIPALAPSDTAARILSESEDGDRKGVNVDFSLAPGGPNRRIQCRFLNPGRPNHSDELVGVALDGERLDATHRYFLIRFWLATPEARAADPQPLGDISALPRLPLPAAYALQQAINGVPLAAVYALLAAAYSLVYGLIGRINLAFGALAAAGGYGAAFGATLLSANEPLSILALAGAYAVFVAASWGYASSRWVFLPLARASGQIALVASIGLALFIQEALRLTQGAELSWVSPVLNQPFGVARAGDFVVTTAWNAWGAAALALGVGLALLALMRRSEFGRQWRALSDDALGAQLLGVNPKVIFALTFTLASALAGVAGFVMTMFYGAVGYGAATTLGLKALVAAILGGIGSLPGAFLGGLIIGAFEAIWSAAFPIDYRDVAVFALLAILLALRPGGILGQVDPAAR